MALYDMVEFGSNTAAVGTTFNPSVIPKRLDIYFRSIESFLPEGKTMDDLTPEEYERIKSQYRFSPYRPGIYQGITGFGPMNN